MRAISQDTIASIQSRRSRGPGPLKPPLPPMGRPGGALDSRGGCSSRGFPWRTPSRSFHGLGSQAARVGVIYLRDFVGCISYNFQGWCVCPNIPYRRIPSFQKPIPTNIDRIIISRILPVSSDMTLSYYFSLFGMMTFLGDVASCCESNPSMTGSVHHFSVDCHAASCSTVGSLADNVRVL